MAVEIIMPKVDMVMETGTFVEWLCGEGEHVEKGQPIFVIMTDKAAIEIEAPASGILSDLRAKPDEVIPVTRTIAYILEPGEKLPDQPAPVIPTPAAVTPGGGETTTSTIINSEVVVAPGKVRATPVARRMAVQLGVNLSTVQGRGTHGRVHKADVLAKAEQINSVYTSTPAPGTAVLGQTMPPIPFSGPGIHLPDARQKQVIPLAGPRQIIAQRMAYSAMTAPHITLTIRVDMTEAVRLRVFVQKALDAQSGRLTYTALIAWVVAKVLCRHPYLNASLANDKIIAWEDVHLGIATHINDYLVVPVIREAQNKTLQEIIKTLNDLLERTRSRRLTPSEMSGSTFTISNLGMLGIESFTAIINPPESAILAIGSIEDCFVKQGLTMVEKPLMKLTLSADHRVIDGAAAAAFLNDVKDTLENPYFMI